MTFIDGMPQVADDPHVDVLDRFRYEDSGQYQRDAARYLCARMSEWSEEHYFAGWLLGLDRIVWQDGTQVDAANGDEMLRDAHALVTLGRDLGYWWKWDVEVDTGPRRVLLRDWLADNGFA